MFAEMIPLLPERLEDFAADVTVDRIRACASDESRAQLVDLAVKAMDEPWSVILASDYLEYTSSGNRSRFEALYFARRLKLNALVLGECIEGEGRFLAAITDGLWLICEESGWQLPAHNAHVRGGSRTPLPDPQNPVIDLFAAETAANLALVSHLLHKRLDPTLVARISAEIDSRITDPYLTRHFWWMGNGAERMNNWTAWITQNVLLATYLRPTGQATRRAVPEQSLKSLDAFQKDYAADGACEEGALYYGHATLCMFGAIAVLNEAASGVMLPLLRHDKLRNMAEFISHMYVADNRFFNFADAPARFETCGLREYWVGKAIESPQLQAFAAERWRTSSKRLMQDEWNLWYRVQAVLLGQELTESSLTPPDKDDIFYPGIELAIARDDAYDLAVKGGNNGESHNHNDVGSITLYKNGRPLLIDVGVETYTAKTFSPQRYDIWTMQSAFHNVPTFGGVMQADGAAFSARNFHVDFGGDCAEISLDLAAAYPLEAGVQSYTRTVRLVRGQHVEIIDEHKRGSDAVLSLMTAEMPIVDGDALVIGGIASVDVEGGGIPTVEAIKIDDQRLRQSWPETIYRTLIPIKGNRLRLVIR
ncbi:MULTISPECIES: heparinase II/III domain-containing protein [unclassified Rhizobium]|uniref:heparinase II/III domain-containing protein n=1 Tax=unclassified Rhizobium TaxID=2613769 RepID=UPI0017874121|nr:heparinase II/III family protein [Rhizobium sp. CFBP 13644]MBD8692706.1 heparinase II/III family protein [Rhizobium sp. CFBP 13717]